MKKHLLFSFIILFVLSGCDKFTGYTLTERILHGGSFRGSSPNFSPKGDAIVFSIKGNGLGDIYCVYLDGNKTKQITNHPEYEGYPRWCPSGEWIYFLSERNGCFNLNRIGIQESNIEQLTHEGIYFEDDIFISPSGTKIAILKQGPLLEIIDLKNKESKSCQLNGSYPHLLGWQDENEIFYSAGIRKFEIRSFSCESNADKSTLYIGYEGIRDGVYYSAISPDKKQFAFVRSDFATGQEKELVLSNLDEYKPQILFTSKNIESPSFSYCGRYIVFLRDNHGPEGEFGKITVYDLKDNDYKDILDTKSLTE